MPTLRDVVDENVREGDLYERLDRNRVRCFACGHCCPIPEGQPGVCKVRYNRGGTLYVPWGYAGGVQSDPITQGIVQWGAHGFTVWYSCSRFSRVYSSSGMPG